MGSIVDSTKKMVTKSGGLGGGGDERGEEVENERGEVRNERK